MTDTHHNPAATAQATATYPNRRLSWQAIIAGALAAIAIQLLLTVLGLAIGFNILQDGAGSGLAVGAGVWWLVSGCIALFFGGWVAGHATRSVDRRDAMLQGFLQWTLVTAVSALMVTSALGSIFSGAFQLTSAVGSAAGDTVQAAMPDNVDMSNMAGQVPWQQVETSVENVVNAYSDQAVQQQGGEQQIQFMALARTFLTTGDPAQRQQRRQDLLAQARQELGLQQGEAEQMVTELEQAYQEVEQTVVNAAQQTQETVVGAAETTAEVTADAAWWTFFSLLLGAILATVGGAVGGRTGGPILARATSMRPVTT